MKIIDYIEDSIPDYALSYLVNGDASGIEDEDKEACDDWLKSRMEKLNRDYPGLEVELVMRDDGEGGFSHSPAFGPACNCVDGAVAVWAENEHPLQRIALPWEEDEEN
jgi:hypothetical protein